MCGRCPERSQFNPEDSALSWPSSGQSLPHQFGHAAQQKCRCLFSPLYTRENIRRVTFITVIQIRDLTSHTAGRIIGLYRFVRWKVVCAHFIMTRLPLDCFTAVPGLRCQRSVRDPTSDDAAKSAGSTSVAREKHRTDGKEERAKSVGRAVRTKPRYLRE